MAIPGIKPRPALPRLLLAVGSAVIAVGIAVVAWRQMPAGVTQASLAPAAAPLAVPPAPAAVPQAAVPQAVVPQTAVPQAAVPQTVVPQAAVPQAAAVPLAAPVAVLAAPSLPVPAQVQAPSFDVVRVSPQGSAVIAGRAEPGAEITVFDGARAVARARADRRGEFVALPAAPLPEGGRELTLAARGAEGPERRSDGAVLVVVPPQPAAAPPGTAVAAPVGPAPGPVAVLVPSAGPPRVLQEQRRVTPMSLDVVDYTEAGSIRFTGAAGVGAALRLYVDNVAVGDIRADAGGRWSLAPEAAVVPGIHTLRIDELDAGGRVVARIELPFQRAAPAAAETAGAQAGVQAGGRVVVQPGQSLWRLARAAYGSGLRYTAIYLANREQIRNPELIYPGQAFTVPLQRP